MRVLLFAVSVILVANLGGCIMECPSTPSDPIEDKEVFGIYCANFGDADRDCFQLLPDSVYFHYYSSDEIYIDSGGWEFIHGQHTGYTAYLRQVTAYHPRVGRCYKSVPEGVVDTTSMNLPLILRKSRSRIRLEYCWNRWENYIKVDSATTEEIREEMLQCLTGE